jgi:hypothetical protein
VKLKGFSQKEYKAICTEDEELDKEIEKTLKKRSQGK